MDFMRIIFAVASGAQRSMLAHHRLKSCAVMFGVGALVAPCVALSAPSDRFCPNTPHALPVPVGRDAELIVDGKTGRILYERNAMAERHPASLTKMMTLYLLFDALKARQISLQTKIKISRHAAAQLKVNLDLKPGAIMTVETAMKAMIVRSANDAAVAIAETLGGTESHFAQVMTAKARWLGMRDTFYRNASGLPDPLQITTASDLAILARHLAYDFPQYYTYFATPSFNYRGVTYYTHDNLLYRFSGTDGIKTGFTNASGFNLVSSAVRDGAHIVGVVMGADTARKRDDEMVRLLSATFVRVHADPSLVARGDVPWQQPSIDMTWRRDAPDNPEGPPAPVISLSAPTFSAALSSSGDIDEDAAENLTGGDVRTEERKPDCVPRASVGRV